MRRAVQTYFNRVDRQATAENADMVLGDYRHRKQKARRADVAGLKSPSMDGMPRTDSIENGQEHKLLQALDDEEFVERVEKALECIEDDENRRLLQYLYIKRPMTAETVMELLGMSNTAYYHAKEEALNAFAEVWPPSPSELIVYKVVKKATEER